MARYILRRLVTLIITLLGIMVVTFFISLVVLVLSFFHSFFWLDVLNNKANVYLPLQNWYS